MKTKQKLLLGALWAVPVVFFPCQRECFGIGSRNGDLAPLPYALNAGLAPIIVANSRSSPEHLNILWQFWIGAFLAALVLTLVLRKSKNSPSAAMHARVESAVPAVRDGSSGSSPVAYLMMTIALGLAGFMCWITWAQNNDILKMRAALQYAEGRLNKSEESLRVIGRQQEAARGDLGFLARDFAVTVQTINDIQRSQLGQLDSNDAGFKKRAQEWAKTKERYKDW